jgi:hypothetical protein
LSNKKKKEEEEGDLLGVDGSHMRMEWERKRIRGNKKRNRMVTKRIKGEVVERVCEEEKKLGILVF